MMSLHEGTEETLALIKRSQKGDRQARDRLVNENLGLVWSIVRRFENRGYEKDDLFQVGCIGLMKAIDKFDAGFEVRLSTYAVPMITGEIKRFLRDDGMIKVSRSLKEAGAKIRAAEIRLQKEFGREVSLQELSEATGILCEDIVMALEANSAVDSIDRSLYQTEGKEVCLVDCLPEKQDLHEKCLNQMLLQDLLEGLEERERELIVLRYFYDKTQRSVAEDLGLTQVQVSRWEKKILQRMRRALVS
jgi:RNA polymerase sporulation-specific sigma factor